MADSLKQRVQEHFQRLLQSGCNPNEAAIQALAAARADTCKEPAAKPSVGYASSAGEVPAAKAAMVSPSPPLDLAMSRWQSEGASRFGPLCLDLVGPFRSICVTGAPRIGKNLLVLDIDHTIYDPSEFGGSKGSTVRAFGSDQAMVARCRPGLHTFLTEVYKEYDIMVWSASDMTRILLLLQQIGMLGAVHNDYRIVAVLDVESMSELDPGKVEATDPMELDQEALTQRVTVPADAIPGQQIEIRSIVDGRPLIVLVPAGHGPGSSFYVSLPGAVSNACEKMKIDADELQAALRMSLEETPPEASTNPSAAPVALTKARRCSKSVKPLSLIWACAEFGPLYNEGNTVIVDDTVDVCRANPHHSIQCSRYYWTDHATDQELCRLSTYLQKLAAQRPFPKGHQTWRSSVTSQEPGSG